MRPEPVRPTGRYSAQERLGPGRQQAGARHDDRRAGARSGAAVGCGPGAGFVTLLFAVGVIGFADLAHRRRQGERHLVTLWTLAGQVMDANPQVID